MAANSQSQHRCVFVGNIPYDATEEQLIQICEEVGPVVSFRLVVDRETGKPKGYGFCEYKDEETALSARRNLQGYEINGRQLRVDFAENDKNSDRNRDQGRGGPGALPNVDSQKHVGGSVALGHPSLHQPMGDSVAMAAATVMVGAFGSAPIGSTSNQSSAGSDPLTRHLSKMSRSQLTEVLSELKGMALQNKEQARQLLLSIPNLSKAIFQVQVMLGMVSPQMLQMPNIWQAPAQSLQTLVSSAPNLPGLPPLPQNKTQSGLMPSAHENRVSSGLPKQYGAPNQFQFPAQSHIQRPQLVPNQTLPQGSITHIDLGHNDQSMLRNAGSHLPPQLAVAGFQPSSSTPSFLLENMDLKAHTLNASEKTGMVGSVAIPPFPTSGVPGRQASNADIEKQAMQLPSDMDSTLLQQVLSLTPEQLASLPPDQQQQVIQLQQILRRGI